MHVELLSRVRRLVRGSCDGAGWQRTGILGVDAEGDAGAALLCPAFIEGTAGFEAFAAFRKIVGNEAVRMRAKAVFDDLASAAQCLTAAVGIDVDTAKTRLRGLPFDLGKFLFAAIDQNETRLRPIGPIGGEAIAAIGDDEEKFLGTLERHVNVHAIVRRFCVDNLRAKDRLRRGKGEGGSEEGEEDQFHAEWKHTNR